MEKISLLFFHSKSNSKNTQKEKKQEKRREGKEREEIEIYKKKKMEVQPFSGTSFVNYRNVEYILLAEFDIVTGSTVKHQFPYEIGVDDQ